MAVKATNTGNVDGYENSVISQLFKKKKKIPVDFNVFQV